MPGFCKYLPRRAGHKARGRYPCPLRKPRAATALTMPRNVSIRARLLLLTLATLLPATAAVLWIVVQTYTVERHANQRLLGETTRALALVVDRELKQRASLLRGLAQSRMLDAAPVLSPAALQAFEQQARRTMQGLEGWLEVRSPDGLLLDTRLPFGERPAAGTASGPWSDAPQLLPLSKRTAPGDLQATLVEPVERQGRTVLNLALAVRPVEMQRIIDQQRLPVDWVGAILDSSGTVVARHPGGIAYAGRTATADLRQHIAAAGEGLVQSTTLDGQRVMSSFSTSSQGWTYVTGMPREQFDGVLPQALLKVGLGAVALLCLAALGAVGVSRSIARPVTSLKQVAAELQAGHVVEPQPTGIAECDDVALALAQASATMRESQAELERQVAQAVQLTREAEQRVSHNQRVEALGRLTGGVAHDFNNLLGVISNSAHLIQRQTTSQKLLVPVAATLRAVEVGSRLTQHLLRFSGRQPVQPRAVSLAAFLPEALELMKLVLGKRVEVALEVDPDTPNVTVDPSELELGLINLALNARDAIEGTGHVWLRAGVAQAEDTLDLPAGEFVVISVGDDGKGLDESLAERVFEPFFSTKGVGQGTGLGLSQVHGLCKQAGGTARLASTPGLGTTVTLVLPAASAPPRPAPAAGPTETELSLQGRRVLLVEDNDELAEVTEALLSSFGATVERAAEASQALRVLDDAPPFDVMLSDVVMPGDMDGVALARRLQVDKPELPVVLISGYSSALASAGDLVVLRKPCAPDDLIAALQHAMAGRSRA